MSVRKGKSIQEPVSNARLVFAGNCSDIRSYYTVHWGLKDVKGIRRHLPVFDKAMYTLVSALWEAYCEDIITEALDILATFCSDPHCLPMGLRKDLDRFVKDNRHELAVWDMAGSGWRDLVRDRLVELQGRREWMFNSPKSSQVDQLFCRSLGIAKLSDSWRIGNKEPDTVRSELDAKIAVRGEICHRHSTEAPVRKRQVKEFFNLVNILVEITDREVGNVIAGATAVHGWWRPPEDLESMAPESIPDLTAVPHDADDHGADASTGVVPPR